MLRARKRKFYRKNKTPFFGRFLRKRLGLELICDSCSKPYLNKPAAQPIDWLLSGSAVASVFIEHSFGKKRFRVQIGRSRPNGQELYVSQFLTEEDLEDVAKAAFKARQFIRKQNSLRRSTSSRSGTNRKKSSRR